MSGRLLAVSWATLPAVFPRSIQVARSLHALSKLGWETVVVTTEPASDVATDPELTARYGQSYEAVRVGDDQAHSARGFLRRLFGRPIDAESAWIAGATRTGLALARTRPFDAIISFAQPWSDHKIGVRLASATGMPWIAHFSDPWVDSAYTRGLTVDQLNDARSAERRVIQSADGVVFPTERMARLVMSKYPSEWNDKVSIVPHGYDGDVAGRPRALRDRLRVVYAGDFYGIRSPAVLIEAVARISANDRGRELEIVFVGQIPDEYKQTVQALQLQDVIRFQSKSSYTEAAKAMASAEVLLVIDAPGNESVFLPSKLIDYLAFARPIIGLTPKSGASADLLARLNFPVVEPDDVEGIECVLRETIAAWREDRLRVAPDFEKVAAEYRIDRTTARLNEAIMSALVRKGAKAA